MTLPVWQALPLTGRALVEASAGTGKTWTLAQLYLLLLERGLQPPQILVCTFTDAAAGEPRANSRADSRAAAAPAAALGPASWSTRARCSMRWYAMPGGGYLASTGGCVGTRLGEAGRRRWRRMCAGCWIPRPAWETLD